MNKTILFILSDIHGNILQDWIQGYVASLSPFFQVKLFDCRELAGISNSEPSRVHAEFLNGGIDRAISNLEALDDQPTAILGFSIGGTIAWKFALRNQVQSLHLVSATRIRKEVEKPMSTITLYFGDQEEHGPNTDWFNTMNVSPVILRGEGHECYRNKRIQELVCGDMIGVQQKS